MIHGKYKTKEERRRVIERLDEHRKLNPGAQAHATKMREQMKAVARRLLNERGNISKVTVQDIAEHVGTSTGGLYLYFPSVMDLWSYLLKEDIQEFGRMEAIRRYIPEELYEVIVSV